MARIKLQANVPFNILEATGLAAGTDMHLVAITDTETLLVYDVLATPDLDKDECIPLVYGTQSISLDNNSVGAWLYSTDNAQVYIDKPFDADWLVANPQ